MILLIDNYDSFVFNVKSMLEQLSNDEILVRRNDEISLSEIKNLKSYSYYFKSWSKASKSKWDLS